MKRIAMFLVFFALGLRMLLAQTVQITGTVTVKDGGQPLSGATVSVKGTTIGTITDFNGKYTLNVPADAQYIVIAFVGLKTLEIPIAGQKVINAELEEESLGLDEVVVVAYGTTKKSSFSGSASSIKGEKLEKIQTSNISKSLEGAVAGLQTTSGSGQPGASASIIIRGLGSISASQSPLIVLDGVPYEGSLNSIATQDVESYTILKDAAANSMYGARGSNGVIIITTKRGKTGKALVNFDVKTGFNSRGVPSYDVITDPGEYYEMYWESLRNNNLANGMSYLEANTDASNNLINSLKYNIFKDVPNAELINSATGKLNPLAVTRKWNDSWIEDPLKKGSRSEYNINISQGRDNSNIYASLSYLDDNGYVVNSNFKRVTGRLKAEQKVGEYIKINGALNYINASTKNVGSATTNYSNIFMFGQQIAPIYPIYLYNINTGDPILDSNGNRRYDFGTEYSRPYASEQNPVATLNADINTILVDAFTAHGSLELNFLKNFKFTVNTAYDIFNTASTEFATPIGGDAKNVGGRGEKQTARYGAFNVNQLLNYKRAFNNHNIDLLLGHESKRDRTNSLYAHMTNFVDPSNPEFSSAARYQDLTSSSLGYSLEGYFSRLDYNFNEKYYLTASYRTDGSSVFSPDNRWGQFWAVGGSWRISKESFLESVGFINELKIKASYGTQGNDNIATWYAYRDLYTISRIDGEPSTSLSFRGNPDLTWEKSDNFNTGIELFAWDNRIALNADFFIKQTKDLLYAKPLAVSEGLPSSIFVNDIDMKNTGFEIEFGIDVIRARDLKWNVNFNITHYKNELTRLPADKAELVNKDGGYQAGSYWRKIGGSIYEYYTYQYAGVDAATGKALYNVYDKIRDANGVLTGYEKTDSTTTNSAATLMPTGKSPIPDFYGGIATAIDYKGIDFSVQTAYQIGGYVMDGVYQGFMNPGGSGENFHKDMFKRWTPEKTDTDVPLLLFEDQDQNATSDRWLTKASYFSIRNITLGYTFPKKWLEKIKIQKIRIYGVADNVFYTSKRKGLDVRQSFTGTVSYVYSPIRTISFGVQIGF